MNCCTARLLLIALFLFTFPTRSPAPVVFTPGEGVSYEPYGTTVKWRRNNAKDQLEVAQKAFDKKDYTLALRAAQRTVKEWPDSDYTPQAQYLVGRCYEAAAKDE